MSDLPELLRHEWVARELRPATVLAVAAIWLNASSVAVNVVCGEDELARVTYRLEFRCYQRNLQLRQAIFIDQGQAEACPYEDVPANVADLASTIARERLQLKAAGWGI